MMEQMKINQLPSKTWNWLKMNETAVSGICLDGSHKIKEALPANVKKTVCQDGLPEDLSAILGGMGSDMDLLTKESGLPAQVFTLSEAADAPIRFRLSAGSAEHSLSSFGIYAKEGSRAVLIMDLAADQETLQSPANGQSALQTKLLLEKDASVTLVQIIRADQGTTVMNDIGASLADGAEFSVIHLFLGGKKIYNGCKAKLNGKKSVFRADIAYSVEKDSLLDMNYIALHEGKKSESTINIDGVLHENSKKIFRGTIDFKKGAKGAVGNEKEDVLLLDDDVINQTIPLILCAEEDVEGNHGATIGQLDEDLVFYLQSRGMAISEIYQMMAKARIDAVLRLIPDEQTKAEVSSWLESEGNHGRE